MPDARPLITWCASTRRYPALIEELTPDIADRVATGEVASRHAKAGALLRRLRRHRAEILTGLLSAFLDQER